MISPVTNFPPGPPVVGASDIHGRRSLAINVTAMPMCPKLLVPRKKKTANGNGGNGN